MTQKEFDMEMYVRWGSIYSVWGFIWQFNTPSKYNTVTVSSFLLK
jgi:hypothetical protein